MIVTCPQCSARYKLDKNKISARGAKITCPRCKNVFVVYREDDRDEITSTPLNAVEPEGGRPAHEEQAPAPPPPPTASRKSAESLDFRKVGISSWKVRVRWCSA